MGILLLAPFFLIRFGLMSRINRDAVKRAAYFAPLLDKEKAAYWIYQFSNAAVVIYMIFLKIRYTPTWLLSTGIVMYLLGLVLLAVSVVSFAAPAQNGINKSGVYRLSRNPMYVSYFIYFMGCAVLTQSCILFALVSVFQIAGHWIILSEERWCTWKFGEEYLQYMEKVRRYL